MMQQLQHTSQASSSHGLRACTRAGPIVRSARFVVANAVQEQGPGCEATCSTSRESRPEHAALQLRGSKRTSGAVAFAGAVLAAGMAASAGPASAQVLDAAGAHLLSDVLRPLFSIFTVLYIVRIPMTWYPNLDFNAFPWVLAFAPTEPILEATRKVIPSVGGLDVSPIVWVGLLSFFSEILLGPQGILVLVERQGGL
mmetsp:Transcript_5553/g.9690  ORF Transcript_5553/g.9690 Transcript_5553/m.9690 type:complete len:198 (-) Transcript_5553:598-1191(-)